MYSKSLHSLTPFLKNVKMRPEDNWKNRHLGVVPECCLLFVFLLRAVHLTHIQEAGVILHLGKIGIKSENKSLWLRGIKNTDKEAEIKLYSMRDREMRDLVKCSTCYQIF